MTVSSNLPKLIVIGFAAVAVGIGISKLLAPSGDASRVDVTVPELSSVAREGQAAFAANCAECHGVNGSGTQKGPPLVHDIYNPGHHADESFVLAARNGVRQHHWPYGNMPPQPQVNETEVRAIVRYIRELQAANGIVERAHTM